MSGLRVGRLAARLPSPTSYLSTRRLPENMLDTAIIGAGPYGLSVAAHCRHRGVEFRLFGRPMDSWMSHMPKGMKLKSDGFASTIDDPIGKFSLEEYCRETKVEYGDAGRPVRLETFVEYGLAFAERMLPELDQRSVTNIERLPKGFRLRLDDNATIIARRVVIAVGISYFQYVPPELSHLPCENLSHSYDHHLLDRFRGQTVAVVGAGSSATDLAGLLNESGADVTLIARRTSLTFRTNSMGKPRSLWQRIRHPKSGLGPGMRSRFYAEAPHLFRYLPERKRIQIVRTHLGPSGGWFAKDKVIGKIPLLLGCTIEKAQRYGDKVQLTLRKPDGSQHDVQVNHVIAATGYRADINRLEILSPQIRSQLRTVAASPALSGNFESSVPGLYFVGLASAMTFGPAMRFAYGAGFTAQRLSRALAKSAVRESAEVGSANVVSRCEVGSE